MLQAADGDEGWQALRGASARGRDHRLGDAGNRRHELTARIRAARGGYTYIMMLSSRAASDDASRDAVRAGADDVLAKPPDPAELERGLIAAERFVGDAPAVCATTRGATR